MPLRPGQRDIGEVKGKPFLIKRNGEYGIKVRLCAGMLNSNQLEALKEITENYGIKELHLTVRQEVLIPKIKEEYLEDALKKLETVGLKGGSAGGRVRNIVACAGGRYKNCVHDTVGIAKQLDKEYGEMELPGAIKIGISGCGYPCNRPQFEDIGLIGRAKPIVDEEKCDGCGFCVELCLMKAVKLDEDKKPVINREKCKMCGRCIQNCPKFAISPEIKGFTVTLGGKGTWPAFKGDTLAEMVKDEHIVPLIGKIIDYFKKNAQPGEGRLRPLVKRIGIEKLKEELIIE